MYTTHDRNDKLMATDKTLSKTDIADRQAGGYTVKKDGVEVAKIPQEQKRK